MPITRRDFFYGSLALPAFAAKPAGERPNILLIFADELPAWILGCYGNKEVRTPNLDRLAQTGTRFLHHFACTPAADLSRATLLTGRTPMQSGEKATISGSDATIGKLLEGMGYVCQAADFGSAGDFLARQVAAKPFFLTVTYAELHPPYNGVARKDLDLYGQNRFETFRWQPAAPNARLGKEMLADEVGSLRKFAAAVTALDDRVGALVSTVFQRRLHDTTLIVFTSMCGSLLGRHGLWDSGRGSDPVNMYDEAISTPLLWSWQGHVPPQLTRPDLVSAYDLMPTICDLTAAPLPGNLCGRSYLPLATGKPLPRKQPWRTTIFGNFQSTDMAREARYKLVLRNDGKGPNELYDLSTDPREEVNQDGNPQFLTVRTELAGELAAWKRKYSA